MSPWTLLLLSILVLVGPWALGPVSGPRPEIHGHLRVFWWMNALFCAAWHRLDIRGMAPLPASGPALLIANHTCGLDPMILQASGRRVLGFMIAQEWYDFWAIHACCRMLGCIPVRRDGRDLAATRAALGALKAGRVVPIFPEGEILPTSGRELAEGKPGVAFIALKARVPVIPAYIWGTPPTTDIGRAILTPSRSGVIYGPPIDLSDFPPDRPNDKATLAAVTDRLMAAIRALRDQARAGEGAGNPVPDPVPPTRHDDTDRSGARPVAVSGAGATAGRA